MSVGRLIDDVYLRCRGLLAGVGEQVEGSPLAVATLEKRLLLSATPAPTPEADSGTVGRAEVNLSTAVAQTDAVTTPLSHRELADLVVHTTRTDAASAENESLLGDIDQSDAERVEDAERLEVVFVDTGLGDLDRLLSDLWSDRPDGIRREVVLLTSRSDAIDQIGTALDRIGSQGQPIDAVHILSHGNSSGIQLGGEWITTDVASERADDIARWGDHLAGGADLLFYGCDLAANDRGQALLTEFGRLTGADLAASTDQTGAAALGGDWVLEFRSRAVETVALSLQDWHGLMAVINVTTNADSGAGSLRQAILDANANIGYDHIFFNVPVGPAFVDTDGQETVVINLLSDLPTITEAVRINGFTQVTAGFRPPIDLRGNGSGVGLTFGSSVNGLSGTQPFIDGFSLSNFDTGIVIEGDDVMISDVHFGVSVVGDTQLPLATGIRVRGDRATIGGQANVFRNVFATTDRGIVLESGTTGHYLRENDFGYHAYRDGTFNGGGIAIEVQAGVTNTQIGNQSANVGTRVVNHDVGIYFADGGTAGVTVSDALFENVAVGGIVYETAAGNDAGDLDAGTNGTPNIPVIYEATTSNAQVRIQGWHHGRSNTTYRLEFYESNPATQTAASESHEYVGATTVTTDASGNVRFDVTLNASVAGDAVLTALATDTSGNVSSALSLARYVRPTGGTGEPVAQPDYYRIDDQDDSRLAVSAAAGVLQNDLSLRQGTLTAQLLTAPAAKSFTFNADGSFEFIPVDGETASSLSFQYRTFDGVEYSAPVTVEIFREALPAGLADGDTHRIASSTTDDAITGTNGSSVVATTDGGAIVALNIARSDGFGSDVQLIRLNGTGQPVGSSVLVGTTRDGDQRGASLARNATGDVLVAWVDESPGNGSVIQTQIFDEMLVAQSAVGSIVRAASMDRTAPAVVAMSDGSFLVAFEERDGGAADANRVFRRVAADGTLIGSDFGSTSVGSQSGVAVAATTGGGFAAVYADETATETVLRFEHYDNGSSTPSIVSDLATLPAGTHLEQSIAELPSGDIAVAWTQGETDTFTMRVGRDGSQVSPPIRLNTYAYVADPRVTAQADGSYHVINSAAWVANPWAPYANIMTYVAADGAVSTPVDPANFVNATQQAGQLVTLNDGSHLVIYSGDGPATDPGFGPTRGAFAKQLLTTATISGRVAIDSDDDYQIADEVGGAAGVAVRLYRDDGDDVVDAGDTLVASTTTDGDGLYAFDRVANGDYYVTFDSRTVTPSSLNTGHVASEVWASQTYASAGAVSTGLDGDDAAGLVTSRHVVAVTLTGSDVSGIDAGFSFTVITTTADGDLDLSSDRTIQGSLRQAIANANAIAGQQTLSIRLEASDPGYDAGTDSQVVTLASNLPTIDESLILAGGVIGSYATPPRLEIDANGQSHGFQVVGDNVSISGIAVGGATLAGINVSGDDFRLTDSLIGVRGDGTTAAANAVGVAITGDRATLGATGSGNVIAGNSSHGITATGTDGLALFGNTIGLAADGATLRGNGGRGLSVESSTNITIGEASSRNTIAGNVGEGIWLSNVDGGTVVGNTIGLRSNRTAGRGNGGAGISLTGSANLTIGGTSAGDENVVAANAGAGIELLGGNTDINVVGNLLGTTADRGTDLANAGAAITVVGDSSDITIGGIGFAVGNEIVFADGAGIAIVESATGDLPQRVQVLANTIEAFGTVAIDLSSDAGSPTAIAGRNTTAANDFGDADAGVNGLQNTPRLDAANRFADGTAIRGQLSGVPGRSYRIEFFVSDSTQPGGEAGGQFVGHATATADASGLVDFTSRRFATVAEGQFVTATATDLVDNQTGEHSLAIEVAEGNLPPVASPDSYTVSDSQTLVVAAGSGVLANDTDPNNGDGSDDTLTAELVTGPTHARSFSLSADGSFTYRPSTGYVGDDSFTYRTFDGTEYSADQTVTITVDDLFAGYTISGTVVEDIDASGTVDPADVRLAGVTVRIYEDDGNGFADAGDTLLGSVLTDAAGMYRYDDLPDGLYFIAVDSGTVSPSDGLASGFSIADVTPIGTHLSQPTAISFDGPDAAGSLATSRYRQQVTLAGGDARGLDAAFSFTAVTSTDATGGGSLAQVVANADAIAGRQTAQFRLTTSDAGYDAGSGQWTIDLDATLTASSSIVLDATTQSGFAGAPVVRLTAAAASRQLVLSGGTSIVRGFVFDDGGADLLVITGGAGHIIRDSAFGDRPTGAAAIGIDGAAGVTVSGNVIEGAGGAVAIRLTSDVTGTRIVGNTVLDQSSATAAIDVTAAQGAITIGGTDPADANDFGRVAGAAVVADDPAAVLTVLGNGYVGATPIDLGATVGSGLLSEPADVQFSLAETNFGGTRIVGSLDGEPNATYTIEVYERLADDRQSSADRFTITTDPLGQASFDLLVAARPLGTPLALVATSQASGRTSEFSTGQTVASAAPTAGVGGIIGYTEGDAPVRIAPAGTLSDNDSATLQGLSVALIGGDGADEVLDLADVPLGLSSNYDAVAQQLRITGPASVAAYEQVLRDITYEHRSDDPTAGLRTLRVTVDDGTNVGSAATMFVDVVAVNDAPHAAGESIGAVEDTTLTFAVADLLANDSDVDSSTLSLRVVTPPANGSLSRLGDTFTFVPGADFNGVTTFTYVVSDGDADSAIVTATLDVAAVNDPPVGVDGSLDATDGETTEFTAADLLALAIDVEDDPLSVQVVTQPDNGTLTRDGDAFTYRSNRNFAGVDSFTYVINDGTADSQLITVVIDVQEPDVGPPAPVAADGGASGLINRGVQPPPPPAPVSSTSGQPAESTTSTTERPVESSTQPSTAAAPPPADVALSVAVTETSAAVEPPEAAIEAEQLASLMNAAQSALDELLAEGQARGQAGSRVAAEVIRMATRSGYPIAIVNGRVVDFAASFMPSMFGHQPGLMNELSDRQDALGDHVLQQQYIAGTAVATGTAFSIGYALWTIRGGYLVASVLTAMPGWSMMDPLPVLREFQSDDLDDDPETLTSMLSDHNKSG